MGRNIFENNNLIWRYAFIIQESEQDKIYNGYGIGNLSYIIETPCKCTLGCKKCPYPNKCRDLFYEKESKHIKSEEKFNAKRDILTLKITDLASLKKVLNSTRKEAKEIEKSYNSVYKSMPIKIYDSMNEEILKVCPDYYFQLMVEKMIKYMKKENKLNKKETFNFIGDLV